MKGLCGKSEKSEDHKDPGSLVPEKRLSISLIASFFPSYIQILASPAPKGNSFQLAERNASAKKRYNLKAAPPPGWSQSQLSLCKGDSRVLLEQNHIK